LVALAAQALTVGGTAGGRGEEVGYTPPNPTQALCQGGVGRREQGAAWLVLIMKELDGVSGSIRFCESQNLPVHLT